MQRVAFAREEELRALGHAAAKYIRQQALELGHHLGVHLGLERIPKRLRAHEGGLPLQPANRGHKATPAQEYEDYTSTTAGAPTERWKRRRSVLAGRELVIASKKGCSLASAEAGVPENFFREDRPELSMYNPAAYTCGGSHGHWIESRSNLSSVADLWAGCGDDHRATATRKRRICRESDPWCRMHLDCTVLEACAASDKCLCAAADPDGLREDEAVYGRLARCTTREGVVSKPNCDSGEQKRLGRPARGASKRHVHKRPALAP